MHRTSASRTRARWTLAGAALALAVAGSAAAVIISPPVPSAASAPLVPSAAVPAQEAPSPEQLPPRESGGGALTADDGMLPAGVTVHDDGYPAVARLDPALLGALQAAATDASADGVSFSVNSGWRSAAYQEQLLNDAVAQYGSVEEAARWVATADTSAHVSGDAVDVGPDDATAWLSEHGARYGLCQIYLNEPWHYELRPEAIEGGCPPAYADPTEDPRMRR